MESMEKIIWHFEASEKINKLKNRLIDTRPILCSERAILATEAYQETENEPYIMRRARVIEKILNNISINILSHELIVGLFTEVQRGAPIYPETGIFWLERELDSILEQRSQDRFIVPNRVKLEIKEIIPYWKNKSLHDHVYAILPENVKMARKSNVFTIDLHERGGLGHFIPDYSKLIAVGVKGIKENAESKIRKSDLCKPDVLKKIIFWKATTIICDAITKFSRRYADEAARMAKKEKDEGRKNELIKIAEICRSVPEKPPVSFHEALQSIWFIQMILHLELNSNAISPGRLDLILYPYLKNDLNNSNITLEEAQELVDCFFIKFNEIIKVWDEEATHVHAGFPMVQNITLAGVNDNGDDASNLLTHMFLNAERHVHLPQPHTTLRVSEKTPHILLKRALDVIKMGGGKPQLVGDNAITSSMLLRGLTLKEARTSACIGCVEYGAIGTWGRHNGGYFNLPKILEITMNNGRDGMTGEKVGIETGRLSSFKTFNSFIDAYCDEIEYFTKLQVTENNIIDMVHEEILPHVVTSMFIPDCIETGKDVTSGGAHYNWTGTLCVGLANLVDSLAAIKNEIFDNKRISLEELNKVLKKNFDGMEDLRQRLLRAPKYGNDDDYVDSILKDVLNRYFSIIEKYRNYRGGIFIPGFFSLSCNLPFGWATGATPDGRFSRKPLADGISPSHGVDVYGPTAVLKSASKIDFYQVTNGVILNQKINPMLLNGEENIDKFIHLIKTYLIDLKGAHVQINVVSADMLRNAQQDPEKYRNLVIRVTGYSAFFVELSKDMQEDIIERTEQMVI